MKQKTMKTKEGKKVVTVKLLVDNITGETNGQDTISTIGWKRDYMDASAFEGHKTRVENMVSAEIVMNRDFRGYEGVTLV
ncbi:MAG: hypothetical protein LRY51_01235 [Geovibrio sp.]|nr:hypothetical protein [Geovibrio sp.]